MICSLTIRWCQSVLLHIRVVLCVGSKAVPGRVVAEMPAILYSLTGYLNQTVSKMGQR